MTLALKQILVVQVSLSFVRSHGPVVETVAVINLLSSFDVSHCFGNHRIPKVADGKDELVKKNDKISE